MKKALIKVLEKIDVFHPGISTTAYYLFVYLFIFIASLHLPGKLVSFSQVSISVRVIWLVALGLASLWIGVFLAKRTKIRPIKTLASLWDARRTQIVFWTFFVIGTAAKLIRLWGGAFFHIGRSSRFSASALSGIVGFLDNWSLVAVGLAFVYYLYRAQRNEPYRTWQVTAWSVFALEVLSGFFSGSKYAAIAPIVVYGIVKHYVVRPSYLRLAILGFTSLIILMPAINFYKAPDTFTNSYMWGGETGSEKEIGKFAVDASVGRISPYIVLYRVFDNEETSWHGKDLKEFFVNLGPPRLLWKDKPVSVNGYGNEFGRRWGILGPDDFRTAVAPTAIGDWYINFGIWGIVFGMALMGFVLQLVYRTLIGGPGKSPSGVLLYSVVWLYVIHGMEGWIAPVYAGLVKMLIVLFVFHLFLVKRLLWTRSIVKTRQIDV